jgi:hypothetical protein
MTNEEWKRAEMLGNVMDQLAEKALGRIASQPRHSAKPEPVSRLGPKGECRFRVIEGGRK